MAHSRPTPSEPLHETSANEKLVSALGKRPEEEDAAIAEDWSPRGGRKRQSGACRYRAYPHETRIGSDGGGRASLTSASPSRSPPRCRRTLQGITRRERHKFGAPGPPYSVQGKTVSQQSAPQELLSPPARKWPHLRRPRPLRGMDRASRSSSDNNDGQRNSSYEAFEIFPIRFDSPTTYSSSELSPGPTPFREDFRSGNLGGQYALPGSPYCTYRAKHARLVRAHSSERARAELRRRMTRSESRERWRRRCSSADMIRYHRSGVSGMTSPLLRREGFGVLESNVTDKVGAVRVLAKSPCGNL